MLGLKLFSGDAVRAAFSGTVLNTWTPLIGFRLQWPILHIRYVGMWQVSSVQVSELVGMMVVIVGTAIYDKSFTSSFDERRRWSCAPVPRKYATAPAP